MSSCEMCRYDAGADVLWRWEMRIPLLAVSQNQLASKGSRRWAYRKFAAQALEQLELAAKGCARAKGKRRVTLVRHWAKRQRAYDRINLAGGLKPVLDGLVELGLLVDDSEAWCEDHYQQTGPSDRPGISIVIEEVGQ